MKSPKSSGLPKKRRKQRLILRRVVGDSMLPTLQPGNIVIATQQRPRQGSVIIIRHGGLEKVKRLQRINGGKLYVVGDNTASSTDSRKFGWLPAEAWVATVIWPRC